MTFFVKLPLPISAQLLLVFLLMTFLPIDGDAARDSPNSDSRLSRRRFRYKNYTWAYDIKSYFVYGNGVFPYILLYMHMSRSRSGKAINSGSNDRVKDTTTMMRFQDLSPYKLAVCANGSPASYYAEQRKVRSMKSLYCK